MANRVYESRLHLFAFLCFDALPVNFLLKFTRLFKAFVVIHTDRNHYDQNTDGEDKFYQSVLGSQYRFFQFEFVDIIFET